MSSNIKISYLILSNFRSGTHYLHSLIIANGYTGHDEFTGKLRSQLPPHLRKEFLLKVRELNRNSATEEQREAGLASLGMSQHMEAKLQKLWGPGSVGILHRAQAIRLYGKLSPQAEAKKLQQLFPNTTFIVLTRDPVECAVSWVIARHYQSFFSHQPKRRQTMPQYSHSEIARWVKKYEGQWAWRSGLIDQLGASCIDYSELLADPQRVMGSLGLSIYKQDKVEKQLDPQKLQWVRRFQTERKTSYDNVA